MIHTYTCHKIKSNEKKFMGFLIKLYFQVQNFMIRGRVVTQHENIFLKSENFTYISGMN